MLKKLCCTLVIVSMQIISIPMPLYENTVLGIQQIEGVSNFTLVIKNTNAHPIITYAPSSYADYQNQENLRFFMPYSMLATQAVPAFVQATEDGIEIILPGKYLHKLITDNTIVLMYKK